MQNVQLKNFIISELFVFNSAFIIGIGKLEYQRAMQRRAIRDAKTPEKMKQAKPVVDDSLTLQGKKDK